MAVATVELDKGVPQEFKFDLILKRIHQKKFCKVYVCEKKIIISSQAVVAHIIVLIAEATVGAIFLVACYKRLKRQNVDVSVVPASASLKNFSQPIVVHVNGSVRSTPTKSSTPLRRGYSLEDLDVIVGEDEDDDEEIKNSGTRRMSLDSKLLHLTSG